jgi:uncharacterized protein (UPF0332 family)
MAFDWHDFLKLARTLSSPGQDEAAHRSAVSRAYYAGFHRARLRLFADDPVEYATRYKSHTQVWEWYKERGQLGDTTRGRIGVEGSTLLYRRNQADYQDSLTAPDKLASSTCHKAAGLIADIAGL